MAFSRGAEIQVIWIAEGTQRPPSFPSACRRSSEPQGSGLLCRCNKQVIIPEADDVDEGAKEDGEDYDDVGVDNEWLWRGVSIGHLQGASLIVLDGFGFGGEANGPEEEEGVVGDDVNGVFGDLEGDGDVGLGGKFIDLIG